MEKSQGVTKVFCIRKTKDIMKARIAYLDSLRGLAILLVVVGHLIQYNYNQGLQSHLFNIIYSFHMPLFFFLCGCTRSIHEGTIKDEVYLLKNVGNDILNKFASLIIPSVAWSILVPLFFQRVHTISIETLSEYWFLNVLFAIYVFWLILSYVYRKINYKGLLVTFLVLGVISCYLLDIYRIPMTYLCFFVAGYFYQRNMLSERIPPYMIALIIVAFLLFVGKYLYGSDIQGSPDRVWLLLLFSSLASISLHWIFSRNNLNNELLSELGKYSLGIYLCHYFFVKLPFLENIQRNLSNVYQLLVLLIFAVIVSYICIGVQKIVEKISWMNGLFYGNWKFLKKKAYECDC